MDTSLGWLYYSEHLKIFSVIIAPFYVILFIEGTDH
jgi:hypothetical protein